MIGWSDKTQETLFLWIKIQRAHHIRTMRPRRRSEQEQWSCKNIGQFSAYKNVNETAGPQKPEPNCALNYSTPWNGPFFYSIHAFPSELNHCSNDGSTIVMKNFVITLFNHFIWLKLILYLLFIISFTLKNSYTFGWPTQFEKSQNSNLMPLNDRSTCNLNIFDISIVF